MARGKQHLFSEIPRADIQRSSFDRSHGYKTTFDAGYLIPAFVDEVLPADTFILNTTAFSRLLSPLTVPVMDSMYFETFFFFVPSRLLWDNWQKFNGEQENPGDSTDYLIPTLPDNTKFEVGSIGDYFGIPTGVNLSKINALPFRAYNLIWDEWFRDENLQDSVNVEKGDGPDDIADYKLLRRGKRHDYFTSALPWPQKGPGVEIPLGTQAPVVGFKSLTGTGFIPVSSVAFNSTSYNGSAESPRTTVAWEGSDTAVVRNISPSSIMSSDVSGVYADLTTATAYTINSLRQAFQVQRLYERDARGGTRYTEILRAHFNVISPDARLQRPEYLGGSSSYININPVQQTSGSQSGSTPQANLAANAQFVAKRHGFTKSFVEHGYIIGLINVRADLSYQQGLNRMWSRQGRFDFYWPVLAHLGEQTILNKEIYAQGTAADDEVFGYQERYAEYRYYPSQITGKLRSTYAQSLDIWHLSQKFDNLPTLSSQFIEDNPPIDRVVAVQDEPQFIVDMWFNMKCVRPMPVYGVPGLVDHF